MVEVVKQRGLGRVTAVEDVKTETLVGDVRDLILQEMRDAKNALPWTVRSEKDQRDMIDRADGFAKSIIARLVNLIAAGNNPAIPVTIKEWKVADELKIALVGSPVIYNLETLIEGGKLGFLVFADKEPYQGEREPVAPAPDQGDLLTKDD